MQRIGNVLQKLSNAELPTPQMDLFSNWEEIVGKEISEIVRPHKVGKFRDINILILKAQACCAVEIQHDSLHILNLVNKYFRKKIFSVVRVVQ